MPRRVDTLVGHALRKHLRGNRPAIGAIQRKGSVSGPFPRGAPVAWWSDQLVPAKKSQICDCQTLARPCSRIPEHEDRLRGPGTFPRGVGIVAYEPMHRDARELRRIAG